MDFVSCHRRYLLGGLLLVAIQIAVLGWFGQPAFSETGRFLFWVNDPFSPDTSQQFSDWYTFSHIIHGMLFFGFLWLVARRLSFGTRLLLSMVIEITWEIAENTPMVIEAYRQQALAVGYTGDSIFNSVCDTGMMILGFFMAWRLPWYVTVTIAVVFELFTAAMIRDNLTLNILNFILPLDVVHVWQSGAAAR